MGVTKIDMYDYIILPGVIRVRVESTRDPSMSDILSEIDKSNGKIFAEGFYYLYLGYDIFTQDGQTFMELKVIQAN